MSAPAIAKAASRLDAELAEQLALRSDALADDLRTRYQLVSWDREQVIGRAQQRTRALARRKVGSRPGEAVIVYERPSQPLESLDMVWLWLKRGRQVRLSYGADACAPYLDLMRGLAGQLPVGALTVDTAPVEAMPKAAVGVREAGPRIALIDRDADRELAAYVLARTCLRRSGFGPRSVRRALLVGPVDLLRRHLGRLWVGAQLGPADDPASFAGPVTAEQCKAYLRACEAWTSHGDVDVWSEGGHLERTDDHARVYVAPAAFGVTGQIPALPLVGPMLVVASVEPDQAEQVLAHNAALGGDAIAIGGPPRNDVVRHVRGALLVERLPPGLPEPRPV